MKKILFLILLNISAGATWLKDIPQAITQSNGMTINCFASGDQYAHRLHDRDNYTIVLNQDDGDFYYAEKYGEKLRPSPYKVGIIDPVNTELVPGLNVDNSIYSEKKEFYERNMSNRNGRDAPTSGNLIQLNIFIRFADDPNFPNNRAFYDVPFNSTTEPSIRDYYLEVSYGVLTVDTYHYPPSLFGENTSYVDEHNRGYYSPYSTTNPEGYETEDERTQREHTLLANAVIAIQNSVPEDLDIDLDDDGSVDAVSFSVYGNVDGWAELLWPHRWALYTQDVYINGAIVGDYSFELTESSYFTPGVLCHEFFHVLGAPDLYHYDGGGAPSAVGGWDVMESTANPPQYMSAFLKWKYGDWIPEIPEITSTGVYTLNPLQQPDNVAYKIASPYSETEYYVVEYRVKEGTYDSNTPGSRDGLLVYRINTEAGNGNAQGPPDEIYVYRPNGTLTENGSFSTAPYNAVWSHTEINDFTNPQPFLYSNGDGAPGGLNILNVSEAEETISFTVAMGSPSIDFNTESVVFNMAPDDFSVQTVSLTNGGDEATLLMFDVIAATLPFQNPVGGPDGGEYFWSTSEAEPILGYNWIDIQEIGTRLQIPTNDQAPAPVSIGFSFPFFDDEYSQCVINPNGWIGFGNDNSGWDNVEIPSTSAPRPAIMAMWDDLNPENNSGNATASGDIYYYRDLAGEYFIVWYDHVVTWQGNATSGEFDFQIILYRDGRFEMNYREMIGDIGSATVGYQNAAGNDGAMIAYNYNFIDNNQSIFVAKASTPDWLTMGTQTGEMSGLLPGGQSFDISLMVNTNDLLIGAYSSMLTIVSEQVGPESIPITLTVSGESNSIALPFIDISGSETGIVELPETVDPIFSAVAQRYTHVLAPNGQAIPIIAQSNITDRQLLHARRILREYLTNVPGTVWGNNKDPVANALALSNAILLLLNDESEYDNPALDALFDAGANGQDLLATEIFPEGSDQYMNSGLRDASYEEILHFVLGFGIQNALPSMQSAIIQAMNYSINNNNYIPLSDLPEEDYDEEYLAMALESYFGLWAHDPGGDHWAGGHEYRYINRQEMMVGDEQGHNIIKEFFGENWRYTAELPPDFDDGFSMSYAPGLAYTNRSRYLKNVLITGDNDVSIIGNDYDNNAWGNQGSNNFIGGSSNDYFIGGEGIDRAVFSGDYDEYAILIGAEWNDYIMSVVDFYTERDGVDTLVQVEEMEFNGVLYTIEGILSSVDSGILPSEFRMFPNYPNPFNPETSIKFELPKDTHVSLVIMDLLGRNIRTLVDGKINGGYHQVNWDGMMAGGASAPSGVYLIQFSTKNYKKTYKALLIK